MQGTTPAKQVPNRSSQRSLTTRKRVGAYGNRLPRHASQDFVICVTMALLSINPLAVYSVMVCFCRPIYRRYAGVQMRNVKRFLLFPQFALVCLLLFGMGRCSLAHSRDGVATIPFSDHNDTRFLFADLDGDRIPDLAQVELQNQRSAKTNYSIHLKLSAGVESAIGVSGPDGGLRVAARDVNGDDALDLIVTANLDANFVEVLLNDGHGNFAVAKGDEFTRAEGELGSVALRGPNEAPTDRVSLANSRFSSDLGIAEKGHLAPLRLARCYSTMVPGAALYGTVLHSGSRSPPLSIAHS